MKYEIGKYLDHMPLLYICRTGSHILHLLITLKKPCSLLHRLGLVLFVVPPVMFSSSTCL